MDKDSQFSWGDSLDSVNPRKFTVNNCCPWKVGEGQGDIL